VYRVLCMLGSCIVLRYWVLVTHVCIVVIGVYFKARYAGCAILITVGTGLV